VVGEDLGEGIFAFGLDERVDGARRELVKSFVGWREDGERDRALQGVYQACGLDGSARVVWSVELSAFSTMFFVGYMAAPPTMGSFCAIADTLVKASAKVITAGNRCFFTLGPFCPLFSGLPT